MKKPVPDNRMTPQAFGRRQEYVVIAELLKRGFDVFKTLVDDKKIDCVIRLSDKKYLDVQIKARSIYAKHPTFFAGMRIEPRPNYWFIFFTEANDTFWVMPSSKVIELGHTLKSGENVGKAEINMPKSDRSSNAPKFEKYKNNFDLLNIKPKEKR
ncbi:hypothetical protein ES707_08444 [subsurface metagenome]